MADSLFRDLFDSMPQLAWFTGPEGSVEFYNQRWSAYTGKSLDELRGRGWESVHDPEVLPRVVARWTRSLRLEEPFEMEFPIRRHDGAMRWFLTRVTPLKDREGTLVRWVGTSTDIHDPHRVSQEHHERSRRERVLWTNAATEEAIEASRTKDRFLAMAGHELRNPLAAISYGLQLLESGDQRPRALRVVRRQFDQLHRLVEDLIDTTRLRQGRLSLFLERTQASRVVLRAVDSARPWIDEGGHELELRLEPDSDRCVAVDVDRAAQILTHLLHRAVKDTPPGGVIDVSLSYGEQTVEIAVRDTGDGLDDQTRATLFRPFRQQQESLECSGPRALGLGLTLAHLLARSHGGDLVAASEGPGRGSTFTLQLPLAELLPAEAADVGGPPRSTTAASPPTRRAPAHLLVIAPEGHLDAASSTWLRGQGYVVWGASSVDEALATAFDVSPRLVLIDVDTLADPGRAAARLRAHGSHPELPRLVALSSHSGAEQREKVLQSGFDEHAVKPVDHGALEGVLRRLGSRPG